MPGCPSRPSPLDQDCDVGCRGVPRESAHHGDELRRQIVPFSAWSSANAGPYSSVPPNSAVTLMLRSREISHPPGEVGCPRQAGNCPIPHQRVNPLWLGRGEHHVRAPPHGSSKHGTLASRRVEDDPQVSGPGLEIRRWYVSARKAVPRGREDQVATDESSRSPSPVTVSHMSSALPKIRSACQTKSMDHRQPLGRRGTHRRAYWHGSRERPWTPS